MKSLRSLNEFQITELAKPLVKIITDYYEKDESNHGNTADQRQACIHPQ